jgi:hypothetical protein
MPQDDVGEADDVDKVKSSVSWCMEEHRAVLPKRVPVVDSGSNSRARPLMMNDVHVQSLLRDGVARV